MVRVFVVLATNTRRSEWMAPQVSFNVSLTLDPVYLITAHRQR
ncbi:hypothetical protein CPCC7001_1821 [Cyanobium sp. PCC 7001]|nr:hypothetical protein CPCC7001_1821 [Cyanobium sp. PCC 7001]